MKSELPISFRFIFVVAFTSVLMMNQPVLAQGSQRRTSYLSGSTMKGPSGYEGQRIQGQIGLSQDWAARGYYNQESSGTDTSTSEELKTKIIKAGLDGNLENGKRIRFGYQKRSEPFDVDATGFYAGMSFEINRYLSWQKRTELSLDFDSYRYTQGRSVLASNNQLGQATTQRNYTATLEQDLSESLVGWVAYTHSTYGGAQDRLGSLTRARRITDAYGTQTAGILSNTLAGGLNYTVSSWLAVNADYAKSKFNPDGQTARTIGVGADLSLGFLVVSFNASKVHYETTNTQLNASNDEVFTSLGLSFNL